MSSQTPANVTQPFCAACYWYLSFFGDLYDCNQAKQFQFYTHKRQHAAVAEIMCRAAT